MREMPELERWVLHRLAELDAMFRQAVDDFDFHRIATELHNFCAVDLSAFYFDIRKDAIYCDAPKALRRRAARTVMAELFSFLTAWLAPDHLLHRRGGLARCGPRTCRTAQATACICALYPDDPRRLARCGAGREVEDGARAAPRRHRRARARARREAHRLQPAGRAARPCRARVSRGDEGPRPLPRSASPRAASWSRARRRPAPSPCPTWRASPSCRCPAHGEKCARCWQVLEEVGKSAQAPAALPALRRGGDGMSMLA